MKGNLIVFWTFFLVLLANSPANAGELSESVIWFEPIVKESNTEGIVNVILEGRSSPKTKFEINRNQAIVVQQENQQSMVSLPTSLLDYLNKYSKVLASGKGGLRKLKAYCRFRKGADNKSKIIQKLSKGKKLWVKSHNKWWYSTQEKGIKGYVGKSCFSPPKISKMKYAKIVSSRVNSNGEFRLSLELPTGLVQVPLKIQDQEGASESLLIVFNISMDKVKTNLNISKKTKKGIVPIVAEKKKSDKKKSDKKSTLTWQAELGISASYQSYSQDIENKNDIIFSNLKAPGISALFGFSALSWGMALNFQDISAEIKDAADPYSLNSTKYKWSKVALQSYYKLASYKINFSVNQSQFPILTDDGSNNIDIESVSLISLYLGASKTIVQNKFWSYSFGLDLIVPISANSTLIEGSVDAKVGAASRFSVKHHFEEGYYFLGSVGLNIISTSYEYDNAGVSDKGAQKVFDGGLGLSLGKSF